MSDNHRESNEGGFQLNTDGINCLPCECRKKTFHKETKINNEGKTIIIIEDRSSWKMGRGITPDENDRFKTNSQDNEGVDTVTTGWGSRKPTPEERLENVEEDVERLDKDVTTWRNIILNMMDKKL